MTRSLCWGVGVPDLDHSARGSDAAPPRSSALRGPWRAAAACLLGALSCVGCRTDMSQQLLERELRMQEDQIYQLQDELEAKCARLERVAGENSSLRRQLGFVDGDAPSVGGRPAVATPAGQPTFVPPPLTIPGGPAAGSPPGRLPAPLTTPAAPGGVAPPTLEGVPPLPAEPRLPGASLPQPAGVVPASAAIPAAADVDPSARPIVMEADGPPAPGSRLSHEESLAESAKVSHIVVNQSRTACFDGTGDGISDGIAVVVEPRDDDERMVTAAGDLLIVVLDDHGGPVARWDIPAQEALAHFRRTSRSRGLHFVLRWPDQPPQGNAVRLAVKLTCFDGTSFETDCMVPARPAAGDGSR
jgi:hypothetical protein